jgi:NAD(P)-dependent dehydrogenase (short-subunit alcohol dehydrogenase family)
MDPLSVIATVNNAGYGDISPIEDTSLDEFRAQIETNLFGVINVTKARAPSDAAARGRSYPAVLLGWWPDRAGGPSPYAAAKWGVEGFSEVLSKGVGPLGRG